MKITALDNVTCEDLGLDPHEDAHQTGDLLEDSICPCGCNYISNDAGKLVRQALRTAWRRGIAFALSSTVLREENSAGIRILPPAMHDMEDEALDPGVCI